MLTRQGQIKGCGSSEVGKPKDTGESFLEEAAPELGLERVGRTPANGGNEGPGHRRGIGEGRGQESQGMWGDRKWPVWLRRACEEKIGDKGGKAPGLDSTGP